MVEGVDGLCEVAEEGDSFLEKGSGGFGFFDFRELGAGAEELFGVEVEVELVALGVDRQEGLAGDLAGAEASLASGMRVGPVPRRESFPVAP